jgi:hypothetical protein
MLPEGDVFIHGGDVLWLGTLRSTASQLEKLRDFNDWLRSSVPCTSKVVIAGNHDAGVYFKRGGNLTRILLSNGASKEEVLVLVCACQFGVVYEAVRP